MKKLLVGILSAATLVACTACAAPEEEAPATEGATGEVEGTLASRISPNEEYIVVNCLNNIEYFNAHKWAWEEAGELMGVKTSWVGPMDDDTNAMVAAFDAAISKNPAGINVWGWDQGLEPSIQKALDAGIPVVTYVGDLNDSSRLTYIGSSQFDIGYEGAKYFADIIGGEGEVAILTIPGSPSFEERTEGFEAGFAEYPGIEVVSIGDTKADSVTAISVAKDILNKNPDLKGFVCADSTGAIGASTAVKEMDMVGDKIVLGLDRNSDILHMIKEGVITASIVQNDVSMQYWALMSLISSNHYDSPLTSDNAAAGVKVEPNNIYTSVNIITPENVDYFLEQNEVYAGAQ